MKKLVWLLILGIVLGATQFSQACVGRTLLIGISNTANDKLLAELVSLLITERTGSAVKIQVYKDSREIYNAVKKGDVNIVLENIERAQEVVGKPREVYSKALFETIKNGYKKNMNMVWLEPFGGPHYYAPVLTNETLTNYPALPKLLNKLAGILTSETYTKLIKTQESDDKPKKVARDFLKAKKLI